MAEQTFDTEGEVREYLEDNPDKAVAVEEPVGDAILFLNEDGELKVELITGEVREPMGDDHTIQTDTRVIDKAAEGVGQ